MARTTPELVSEIIETEKDVEISPFIDAANLLVTERCATAPWIPSTPYTDAHLELIERWLAAHFYAIFDPRESAKGIGSSRAVFEGKSDMYLEHTRYGQHAMLLDTNGGLSSLNSQMKKGKVAVHHLGSHHHHHNW